MKESNIKEIANDIYENLKLKIKPFNKHNFNSFLAELCKNDEEHDNELDLKNKINKFKEFKFEEDNEINSNMSTEYDSNYFTSDFCYLNMEESNNKYEDLAYDIYDNLFLSSNYGDLTDEEISEFILELFKLFQENNG